MKRLPDPDWFTHDNETWQFFIGTFEAPKVHAPEPAAGWPFYNVDGSDWCFRKLETAQLAAERMLEAEIRDAAAELKRKREWRLKREKERKAMEQPS